MNKRVLNMDVMLIAYENDVRYEWLIKFIYDNRLLEYTQQIIEKYDLEDEVNYVRTNRRTYNKVV